MIKWNEGLNLGVKILDDDHKKILDIINELTLAISNDIKQVEVDEIFDKLQNYTQSHFKREETLFKNRIDPKLKEHMEQHQNFVKEIPKLKEKLLSLNNKAKVQEVSFFLTDWLFQHIIEEDSKVLYFISTNDNDKIKKDDTSFIKKLIQKTTNSFSFTKRILLLSIVPLIGMLILGFMLFWNNYTQYKDIRQTSNIINIISDINLLAHGLQIERGLSSGYISSSQLKFKNKLNQQRQKVNTNVKLFNIKLKTINKNKIETIQPLLKAFEKDISAIKHFRIDIDNNKISQKKIIDLYTKTINNILSITSKMSMFNLNKELSSSISTLSSLLHYKESLGLKRAYGTIAIESKNNVLEEFLNFIQLLGTQKTLLNNFNNTATQNQIIRLNSIIDSPLNKQIKFLEKDIEHQKFNKIDSLQWFQIMTELINNIKLFEQQLLFEVELLIENELQKSIKVLTLWLIYTALIFIITMAIIYVFEESSKNEIYQLIEAMKHLAHGGRTLRLDVSHKKDDMAQIYEAYEITRKNLLKGDMYAQLYLNIKELEIKAQQNQNTKLKEIAFTDSLTGLINRRKFDKVSAKEIKRASRYDRNLSFLMMDIDFFKSINDTYGHSVGDKVLQHFSNICIKMIRDIDITARIGGEEFVIMLPETNSDNAYIFAERFREKISNSTIEIKNQKINYTVSIGIAKLRKDIDENADTILCRADKALYKAKESGRNRTEIYKV